VVARCAWEGHWKEEFALLWPSHLAFHSPASSAMSAHSATTSRIPPVALVPLAEVTGLRVLPAAVTGGAIGGRAESYAAGGGGGGGCRKDGGGSSSSSRKTRKSSGSNWTSQFSAVHVHDPAYSLSSTYSTSKEPRRFSGGAPVSPLSGLPCLVVETVGRCHYLCFASLPLLHSLRAAIDSALGVSNPCTAPHHQPAQRTVSSGEGAESVAARAPVEGGGGDLFVKAPPPVPENVTIDPRSAFLLHSSQRWRGMHASLSSSHPNRLILNVRRFDFDAHVYTAPLSPPHQPPPLDYTIAADLLKAALALTPEPSPAEMNNFLDLAASLRVLPKLPKIQAARTKARTATKTAKGGEVELGGVGDGGSGSESPKAPNTPLRSGSGVGPGIEATAPSNGERRCDDDDGDGGTDRNGTEAAAAAAAPPLPSSPLVFPAIGREEESPEGGAATAESRSVDDPTACHVCFWVNVYHALLQHALVLLGPPRSPRDWASFHSSVSYELFGNVFSLLEIRHCVLRPCVSTSTASTSATATALENHGSTAPANRGDRLGRGSPSSSSSSSSSSSPPPPLSRTSMMPNNAASTSAAAATERDASGHAHLPQLLPKHYPKLPPPDDERWAFNIARLVQLSEDSAAQALTDRQNAQLPTMSPPRDGDGHVRNRGNGSSSGEGQGGGTCRGRSSSGGNDGRGLFWDGNRWDPRLNFVLHDGTVRASGPGVVVLTPHPGSLQRQLNERTTWNLEHTGEMLADPAALTLGPLPSVFEMFPGDFHNRQFGYDSLNGGSDNASAADVAAKAGTTPTKRRGSRGTDGGGARAMAMALQRQHAEDLARFCLLHVGDREQWKRLSLFLLDGSGSGGSYKVTYAPMRFVSYESLVDVIARGAAAAAH